MVRKKVERRKGVLAPVKMSSAENIDLNRREQECWNCGRRH